MAHQSFQERSRQEYEETYVPQERLAPSPEVAYEAEEALRTFTSYIKRKFDAPTAQSIVTDLRGGESQRSIAGTLGKSPQVFGLYMSAFRKKAA